MAPVGGSARTATTRLRLIIMGAQIAVACVLLIGAGLLGRSFVSLIRADRGYDATNLLTAGLGFPCGMPPARRVEILENVQQRLRTVPGVRQAAFGIGIRTALGATPRDIVALIVRQAMTMTAGGLVVGLLTAYFAAESLSKILYGITPHDVLSFTAVPVVLAAVAAIACALPARRAARIDPLRALRRSG
jgi:FtsX-like permease family protein